MKSFVLFIDLFNIEKPNGESISSLHLVRSLNDFRVSIIAAETDYLKPDLEIKLQEKNIFKYFFQVINIFKVIKKNSVIFINSIYSIRSMLIPVIISNFKNQLDCKIIISTRGMLSDHASRGLKKRIYLKVIKIFLNKNILFQVSNTKELAEFKNNFNPSNDVVISSDPVSSPPKFVQRSKISDRNIKIIYFGRLSYIKNIIYAYEIFNLSSNKFDFHVYGEAFERDKNYFNKCNSLLESLDNLNYRYFGHAPYENRLGILSNYDLCLVPSFSENFCHTIYDSLSVGTPVLTTEGVPWAELNTMNAGKHLPLSDINSFLSFIDSFHTMKSHEVHEIRKNAYNCATKRYAESKNDLNKLIRTL